MKQKILALLLAVMMIVVLIPAAYASAEEGTEGGEATSPVLTWLTHGVDDCFGVYDQAGNEIGKYKTLADADLAMKNNAVLKFLGNIKGVTESYTFFKLHSGLVYTIDGQGYVLDVQLSTAKSTKWKYDAGVTTAKAFAWVFNPDNANDYIILNVKMVSNAGCMQFYNKDNNVKATYVLNNVELYASDMYYTVNPAYYCPENGYGTAAASWLFPTVPYNPGTDVPANGYTAHTAVEVTTGSTNVTFNGANTKVIGRGCAINGMNGRITINDGYFYANDSGAYWKNGDAGMPADSTTSSDGATIMLNWSNGVIDINGGEIVNEGEWHVAKDSGGVGAVQCEAIRVTDWQKININGGTLRAPGSVVHVRRIKTGNGVTVNVKGGVLISDEFGVEWAATGGQKKKESTEAIIWISHAASSYLKPVTVNIAGGMFVNKDEMDTCMLFNHEQSNAIWNLTGGVFLSTMHEETKLSKIYSLDTDEVKLDKKNTAEYDGEEYFFCGMLPLAHRNAPTMEVGAAVRLKANGKNALRFSATLTATQRQLLEDGADDDLMFGAVIVPTETLYKYGCYTIDALKNAVGLNGFDTVEVSEDDLWESGAGYGYYIVYDDIADDKLATSYTAIPYATDGITYWYGSFNPVDSSRSVAEVAARALADVVATKGRLYADASVLANIEGFDYTDVTFDKDSIFCYYQADSQAKLLSYLNDEYKAIAVAYAEEAIAKG